MTNTSRLERLDIVEKARSKHISSYGDLIDFIGNDNEGVFTLEEKVEIVSNPVFFDCYFSSKIQNNVIKEIKSEVVWWKV